jgi:hypothetical protein
MDIVQILIGITGVLAFISLAMHLNYNVHMLSNNVLSDNDAPCPSIEVRRYHAISFYIAFSVSSLFLALRYLRNNMLI